ncbi:beta-eliminating lyase-related protein [Kitasatospora sp. NPDC127059]|uniref:beta-eliminating lyase-related protein n=1 Tax=unclassified Kitasatospora TaxID=2633591 RepID=UPI00365A783D
MNVRPGARTGRSRPGTVAGAVPNRVDGTIALAHLAAAFPDDPQFALPSLICLENTHNRCGGAVLPLDCLAEVRRIAALTTRAPSRCTATPRAPAKRSPRARNPARVGS